MPVERITNSRPAVRVKAAVSGRFPGSYAKLKRGFHAARRGMREPPAPRRADERLFWDPPPRTAQPAPVGPGPVTNMLYERLTPEDLAELERRLEGEDAEFYANVSEAERRWLAIPFSVHYQVPGVAEKLGLWEAMPPKDHGSSGSGALAAGGSTYYADMLAEPLERAGAPLRAGQRALEFGCASGRTVRVLAAAFPDVEWHACDPDRPAIEWAQANLPGIHFFVSDVEPPLPFPDEHLDVVNAHGVWTHFSQAAALRWFEEMHRVLKPGGHFVFTVHGNQSVQLHASDWGGWDRRAIADVATELYTEGHKFVGAYGRQGHHNLATADWGEAFMTPEWVLERLLPRWRLLEFEMARAEGNLDLYVMERR